MSVDTLVPMASTKEKLKESEHCAEMDAAVELVRQAKAAGLNLTGRDGLLKQFTKTVIETALDEEMTEHLGRAKHVKTEGGSADNARNGKTSKTVLTDTVGQVQIDVPRDRAATFEPVIVPKRQRRLNDVDEVVLSLHAKGLTTGEISAHFHDIYGASVSKETISRITDRVVEEMHEWANETGPSASCLTMLLWCVNGLEPLFVAVF